MCLLACVVTQGAKTNKYTLPWVLHWNMVYLPDKSSVMVMEIHTLVMDALNIMRHKVAFLLNASTWTWKRPFLFRSCISLLPGQWQQRIFFYLDVFGLPDQRVCRNGCGSREMGNRADNQFHQNRTKQQVCCTAMGL